MRSAVLALSALLAGCTVFSPKADHSNLFVLTATSAQRGAEMPLAVGIGSVRLPDYLDRSQIVTREGENRIVLAEQDRWGEPLRDGFARALRLDLASELGSGRVVVQARHDVDVVISVEVLRFERVATGVVELAARWGVRDAKSGVQLLDRESHIRLPVSSPQTDAAVASLSRALAAMSADIAQGVREVAPQVAAASR
jgi:uncharacterized lipoprotein YmbA